MSLALYVNGQTSYSRYDVNNDHEVNVTDVTKLVNIILGTETSTRGDVNRDDAVNVNDVTALVDYILGKRIINGHEFVDLGLPSGTLWATQNMGANSPEDYGDYYAWGEIEPKTNFSWDNYSLCDGTISSLSRYNVDSNYGTVDGVTQLDIRDDAANQQWGGLWCIPTEAQAKELKNQCSWSLDVSRGGYTVVGPNGNSIFMPMSGYVKGSTTFSVGKTGYYWTSNVSVDFPYDAVSLVCEQSAFDLEVVRCYGRTIRPVAK